MSAKTDVVVKLVLVFFISLLSFSIGTFVGKKYSDNQHKLSALEPGKADDHGSRSVASAGAHGEEHGAAAADAHGTEATASTHGKSGDTMSDEEIAKLAEEFVSDDTTATSATASNEGDHAAPATAGHGDEHKSADSHKASSAPSKVAPGHKAITANAHDEEASANTVRTRTLDKAQPLAAAKKIIDNRLAEDNRNPSSIPKDVGQYNAGKFTVQVGSYAKEDDAQKMAGDLKAKGYSAYYIPANVKGQTWYRVSVGLFATPREAQEYRTELMGKSKITSAIVQKIVQ